MVNLAIVGYGNLARSVYGPAIKAMAPSVSLSGIVELDPTRRSEARAALPGTSTFDSLEDLLAAAEVDGVLIATPPTTHAQIACSAFDAGLAVYVEKPLAADATDGQRILDTWKRAGTVGMVGFNYRFNSQIRQLQKSLAAGQLGAAVSARTYFGLATVNLPPWKRHRDSGGGALLDLGSHHIDLLAFLLQAQVETVSCHIWSERTEDDNAALTLVFSSGVVAQTHVSLSSVEEDRIEICGRDGKLIYDRYFSERLQQTGLSSGQVRTQLLVNRVMSFVPSRDLREKLRSPMREPSFPRAIGRFANAIATGEPTSPDIAAGWRCLQVILAAEQSHREGRAQEVKA